RPANTFVQETGRGSYVGQALRASLARDQSTPWLGMAHEPEEGLLQPHLQSNVFQHRRPAQPAADESEVLLASLAAPRLLCRRHSEQVCWSTRSRCRDPFPRCCGGSALRIQVVQSLAIHCILPRRDTKDRAPSSNRSTSQDMQTA